MKPIGQTFFINEPPPPTGAAGVYVTRIDVYFKTVSSQFGVELQIRETQNGVPTSNRLPFASKVLNPGQSYTPTNAKVGNQYQISAYSLYSKQFVRWTESGTNLVAGPLASNDASIPTPFIFDTPIFLESGKSYAFVVAPLGGNPDYNIWTAEIGQTDVLESTPIYTNNDSGDLFLSSNDIGWQPVINEDLKYTIYTANFTAASGNAYFNTPNEEWKAFKNISGSFLVREPVVFGNGYFDIAVLNVTGTSGTISVGDTVYQSNGTANVSGVVYSATSSVIKIANATGAFSTTVAGSPLLYDANTSANTSVSSFSQNVITTATSDTITVPDSSIFTVEDVIYIQTNNRSKSQVVKVIALPSSTSVQVNAAITFTETNALYGRVIADGALTGRHSGSVVYENVNYGLIDSSTSTLAVNLSDVKNVQMIGLTTGSSAQLINVIDPVYNSLTTQFSSAKPSNTYISWAFKGFQNDTNRTPDTDFIPISDGVTNEFIDKERVAMSRSNELGALPTGRSGNNSVVIKASLISENNKITPVIDTMRTNVNYTFNIVPVANDLSGVYLSIDENTGTFTKGDIVSQISYGNTTTGIIREANSSYIRVTGVNGKFVSNVAFSTNASVSGFINTAEKYDEANNNGYYNASRYISKNVVLAAGQDSEDIRAYLAAFRPANTNLYVYAKVQSSIDNEVFNTKAWSKLREISPASLQSSKVNVNDQVELVYGFETSQNIFLSNTVTSNTSNTVYCQDTSQLSNNMIVYMEDQTTAKTFNVREIVYVINSTAFVVDRFPSYTSSNASLGYIPGVESTTSAFLYDQNNNIVRYTTASDGVYDNFIQFAMKIMPIADTTALVPRVGDVRVLALQV